MTIHSNPPGALVTIDGYEIGVTPVSTDFVYYGTREFKLSKSGYETVTVKQPIRAPWYQWMPLDFVSEVLVPVEIRDERSFAYNLQPQVMVPTEQLLGRAENLRRGTAIPAAHLSPAPPGIDPQPLMPRPETLPPGGIIIPEELPPGGIQSPQFGPSGNLILPAPPGS